MRDSDILSLAKVKCEPFIEYLTTYDLSLEVSKKVLSKLLSKLSSKTPPLSDSSHLYIYLSSSSSSPSTPLTFSDSLRKFWF
ncbi:hypothetical protein ACLB2K_015316 [Fragaria x ananassa]